MKSIDELKNIPSPIGLDRGELLDILLREEYGYQPPTPNLVEVNKISSVPFCAGKTDLETYEMKCTFDFGEFTFPFTYTYPKNEKNAPLFIHINFRPDIPDKYQPTEELIDECFAIMTFCYKNITSDDGDFDNGLSGVLFQGKPRSAQDTGKIGMWAWAAVRLLEYALTLPEINHNRIAVVGHSRLGKTALLAGALDERFFAAISNDSGCSGAGLSRGKTGETVKRITDEFPFWFCENYKKYADREYEMPFDQHFLLSANYPNKICVGSAVEDETADPESEFLTCLLASKYYEDNGMIGYVGDTEISNVPKSFEEGNIAYHLREGRHYFSRDDWKHYITYMKRGM